MAIRIHIPDATVDAAGRIVSKKRSKFNTKTKAEDVERRQWVGDRHFDSRDEANCAAELQLLKRAGQIRDIQYQVEVELCVRPLNDPTAAPVKVCSHRVDFLITHNGKMGPDGSLEYLEFKGFATSEYRIKAALFRALWPERKYTIKGTNATRKAKRPWPKRKLTSQNKLKRPTT